jgi:multidrug efflux pump subunit AcrB
VVEATKWPLLGGTAVGILAFSAIGLSPTDMGEYAGSLFWVILYSMLLSWLFAVTLTPLFCVRFLKVQRPRRAAAHPVLARYRACCAACCAARAFSGPCCSPCCSGAVVGFGFVPPGFMPESARPQFVVDMYLPQGTDIERTGRGAGRGRRPTCARSPGVSHVTSFIGQGGLRFMLTYSPEDPNSATASCWWTSTTRSCIPALVSELQGARAAPPGAEVKAWKFMLGRGGGKKIEAAFRGPDPAGPAPLADQAKAIMAADPGAVAVQDDWRQKVPVLRPWSTRGRAARRRDVCRRSAPR